MSQHDLPEIADEPSDDQPAVSTISDEIVSGAGSEEIDLKEMTLVDEDNAYAQITGSTGPQKRQVNEEWLANFLADRIYSENSATIREQLQNAETACLRAAKLLLRNHPDYGQEWLTRNLWVNSKTGETLCEVGETNRQTILAEYDIADENLRQIELPRSLSTIVDEARSVGYDPTIEVSLFRDDREIHIEDNGIGMTAEELNEAYNYTGNSGAKLESDTGGMFGAGELTFGNFTGKDGGMTLVTRTRRSNADELDYEGHKMYVYLGGMNPMPNEEIPDDFKGTRKEIPILPSEDGGPKLHKFDGWVEEYADTLRVPVLYREFENGETPVKEEYGGQSIIEKFSDEDGNEPPVVVDRPGEFTAVAGPDVNVGRISYNDHRPDTWLVSMPIERNTKAKVKSFWKVGIQIHNEQRMCVAGPHRGMLKENVDDPHPDDVFTPQPTGTRDQLEKDSDNKQFFRYVSSVIKEHELAETKEIVSKMIEADDPIDVVRENPEDWQLFHRMVDYHGVRRTKTSMRKFKKFVKDNDAFPSISWVQNNGPKTKEELAIEKIFRLFDTVSHAPADVRIGRGSQKGSRKSDPIGDILAKAPVENIYMAASTGGKFKSKRRVVKATHDNWDVIVVKNSAGYSKYENLGFKYLKEVPVTKSDDHDYNIPEKVHERNKKTKKTSKSQKKAKTIEERILKIRDSDRNKSIDKRWDLSRVVDNLQGHRTINGKPLVLFPGGKDYENISDHYGVRSYAAIASCNQKEYKYIADRVPDESVFTYEEFRDWSLSTVIATEKGGRQVRDLMNEDEFIVLTYASRRSTKELLKDENETLRNYYKEDALYRRYDRSDDDIPEPVFAVADSATLRRADYGLWVAISEFNDRDDYRSRNYIRGLRLTHSRPSLNNGAISFYSLNGNKEDYHNMAKTPQWHDGSEIYRKLRNSSGIYEEFLLGCHDAGFDPTLLTEGELREIVGQINPDGAAWYGSEPEDAGSADEADDSDDEDDSDGLGELFG